MSVLAKAHSLVAEGKVRKIPTVVFEAGPYTVVVKDEGPWCSCPATVTCSHILATGLVARREQVPA
jgi:hypothetical protein